MSVKPGKAPGKSDAKHDAKDEKSDAKGDHSEAKPEKEPFVNEPSSLDETTHRELELLHREASQAILFAKSIQWRTVGATLLVYGGFIGIAALTEAGSKFVDVMKIVAILLACGAIFVLLMYQFWQVNEINRINAIERNFSTLFMRISRIKSRREGNFHRYTILVFMMLAVMLGVVVVTFGVDQAATLHKPPY